MCASDRPGVCSGAADAAPEQSNKYMPYFSFYPIAHPFFPAPLLLTVLFMSLVRGLHSDAHMRPLRVVEVDYFLQGRIAFRPRGDCHFVKPFYLKDAIGPFRNGILKGITALCHADAHATLFEFRDILVAARSSMKASRPGMPPLSQNSRLTIRYNLIVMFVVGLSAVTKQPAKIVNRIDLHTFLSRYKCCLRWTGNTPYGLLQGLSFLPECLQRATCDVRRPKAEALPCASASNDVLLPGL